MKAFLLYLGIASSVGYAGTVSDDAILQHATQKKFYDPPLALAIAKVESSQKAHVRHQDHFGLMQIKIGTARMLGFRGKTSGLFDWRTNLDLAMRYLTEKHQQYRSRAEVIAAYNAGAVYVCRTGVSHGRRCRVGRFVNQPYVDAVMRHYRTLPST